MTNCDRCCFACRHRDVAITDEPCRACRAAPEPIHWQVREDRCEACGETFARHAAVGTCSRRPCEVRHD
jgi:hypothetical protein